MAASYHLMGTLQVPPVTRVIAGGSAVGRELPTAGPRRRVHPARAVRAGAAPHLELEREDGSMLRVELQQGCTVIGRWAEAGVVLNSRQVSRRHAEVMRDPFGRWWIRDLGSRNGFAVNGEKVMEHVLQHGDEIAIQPFHLRFVDPCREAHVAADKAATITVADLPGMKITLLPSGTRGKINVNHLATLSEFAHGLLQTGDEAQRMHLLCRLMIRDDFHARSAVVLRLSQDYEESPPQALCSAATAPGETQDLPYISRRLMSAVRKHHAPVLASSRPTRENGGLELSIHQGTLSTAAIACPLRIDDRSIDLLYAIFPAECGTMQWIALVALAAQHFQQSETMLTLQRQASERSALEAELTRAREIQMRLVPRNVAIAGLEVEVGFKPCRCVGGDLADAIRLPDGRAVLLVADVCGKGMAAALVSSGMHTVIRGLLRTGLELTATINHLNEYLCSYLPASAFVTMLAVVIDPETGQLECINAGHPGGVVVSGSGEVRTLPEGQNLPLGIDPRELTADAGQLEPGELLALFTDGLTELRDDSGHMLGADKIAHELRRIYSHGAASLAAVSVALADTLDQIQGGSMPPDDRTYLLARRPARQT